MSSFQTDTVLAQARRAFTGGDLAEAERLAGEVLKTRRSDVNALEILGLVAMQKGDDYAALDTLKRCAAKRPKEGRLVHAIGKALSNLGRTAEAVTAIEKALRLLPDDRDILFTLAATVERAGDHDRARALLDEVAQRTDGTTAEMYKMEARLAMYDGRHADAAAIIRDALADRDWSAAAETQLQFVLVKALDKAGDYDGAFEAAARGNTLSAEPFDPEAYVQGVDRLLAVFDAARIGRLAQSRIGSDAPVWVCGLPRSGTTLVEQILQSHPNVYGAGELSWMPQLLQDIQMRVGSYEPYPDCLDDLTPESCTEIGNAYLAHLRQPARTAKRVVDKTLDNFTLVGLLWQLVPRGRTIWARRDPMDTCLSCFVNFLNPKRLPFTTGLRALGVVYRQHERLMRHWAEVLDLPTMEVSYEALIGDQETVSRAMVEHCGLPWNDGCLQFHTASRAVMTASYDQVNQPIYRSSMGRWRNYEAHLGTLMESLGQSGK